MSGITFPFQVTDEGLVGVARRTEGGRIYVPKLQKKHADDSWDVWDHDERGRLVAHRHYDPSGSLTHERAWPNGSSFHAEGENAMNAEYQAFLGQCRRAYAENDGYAGEA
jgi:hypothetical protein